MKKRVLSVFLELIKNSKESDRNISKKLKISQPTVTRIRQKLEKLGYIQEYTVIPNFPKLGFEIVAFIFFNANRCLGKKIKTEAHRWIENNPSVIFSAAGDGIRGKNCAMFTIHRNFTEYTKFLNEFKTKWSDVGTVETFLVSLDTPSPKNLSFKNIVDIIK